MERSLVKVLRHTAIHRGLEVHEEGFVNLVDLQHLPEFHRLTIHRLQDIAHKDAKGRLELRYGRQGVVVRACQGHSFPVSLKMPRVFPSTAIHGTTESAWTVIREDGLRPMGRQHIHLASSLLAKSGIRASSAVIIELDTRRIQDDDVPLFISENGVILTQGCNGLLCPCYFKLAYQRYTGVHLRFGCAHH